MAGLGELGDDPLPLIITFKKGNSLLVGEIKCQWGQFAESLDLFDEAFTLLPEGDLEARRWVLLDMTIAYEGLNDFKKCEKLLTEVVEIDKKISCEDIQDDLDHLERIRTIDRA